MGIYFLSGNPISISTKLAFLASQMDIAINNLINHRQPIF